MMLSIVIVSHEAARDLERCVESLHRVPPAIRHDVTVVDNASTDDSVEVVRRRWPGVQLIALDRNRGFAAGNNVGIRATRGDLLLLLNSDTVVPAGAVDMLVARLRSNGEAAVAGPRLIDENGRAELSFGAMISPFAELRQRVLGAAHEARMPPIASWVDRQLRREQFVDWVSGACLLVFRADADAVGLLDERFFLYTEDVDFCAAIRARGRRILFTPAAEVTHLRGRSRRAAPAAANAAYRRSQIAFYEKHHPRWAPMLKTYLRLKGALPDAEHGARNAR